jgi:hypothetical protein
MRPRLVLHVDEAAIVLVGDVDSFGAAHEAANLGPIVIEPDEIVGAPADRWENR